MKLEIGIPCGQNSEKYTEYLIKNIDQTISNRFDYRFILGITNSKVKINDLKKIDSKKKIKIIKKNNFFFPKNGSIGHGLTLNLLYENMIGNYGLIVDSDVAFLEYSWDKIFHNMLGNNNIIIGSEYDGKKYKNFPNAICCFFDLKKIQQIKIDWKPVTFMNKLRTYTVKEGEENFFGVKKNSIIFKDTGYNVFYNIKKRGFDGIALKLYRKNYSNKKFIDTEGEEYQLNNKPIFTHLGRSLTRDYENDFNAIKWRQNIKIWLNK